MATGSIDRWRRVLTPDQARYIEGQLRFEMERFGYRPDNGVPPRARERLASRTRYLIYRLRRALGVVRWRLRVSMPQLRAVARHN